jgi:hypothetical protein
MTHTEPGRPDPGCIEIALIGLGTSRLALENFL